MKKEKGDDDSSVRWTYGGKEEEWNSFDRRMMRFMRKKLDSLGEKLWMGEEQIWGTRAGSLPSSQDYAT